MLQSFLVEIGQAIKAARLMRGETQGRFAKELGCSQGLISKYEQGKVMPPANIVIHCMNILGIYLPAQRDGQSPQQWNTVYDALGQLTDALGAVNGNKSKTGLHSR